MQPDDNFFNHLATLSNGLNRQTAYSNYKSASKNYCFELNGALRGGMPYDQKVFTEISSIIRAKNSSHIKVYRMTSDYEFTPSGPLVMLHESFRYPCFLSTTRNVSCLQKFYPSIGTPTVLEINVVNNTAMALMENGTNSVGEAEILLGAGTEFKICNAQKITDDNIRASYVGAANVKKCAVLYYLTVDVVSSPPHLAAIPSSEFFSW